MRDPFTTNPLAIDPEVLPDTKSVANTADRVAGEQRRRGEHHSDVERNRPQVENRDD